MAEQSVPREKKVRDGTEPIGQGQEGEEKASQEGWRGSGMKEMVRGQREEKARGEEVTERRGRVKRGGPVCTERSGQATRATRERGQAKRAGEAAT